MNAHAQLLLSCLLPAAAATAAPAAAEPQGAPPAKTPSAGPTSSAGPNRFSIGLPIYWGAEVRLQGRTSANPGSTAPGTDHFYDDGYNRLDASGNAGEGGSGLPSRTGYFGYQSGSQFNATDGTLALHAGTIEGGSYERSRPLDPLPGLQLGYQRQFLQRGRWELLGEVGIAWVRQSEEDRSTRDANVSLLTDLYQTSPVDLTGRDRYAGPFEPRPGDPRIGDIPGRSVASGPGTISGWRETTLDLVPIHFGPTLELEIAQSLRLGLHAGGVILPARGALSYHETLTAPGGGSVVHRGAAQDWFTLFGWQVQGSIAWHWNERWGIQLSGRYLDAGDETVSARHRQASFDTSGLWGGQLALTRRF